MEGTAIASSYLISYPLTIAAFLCSSLHGDCSLLCCLKCALPLKDCNEAVTGLGCFAEKGYFQSPGEKGEEKESPGSA